MQICKFAKLVFAKYLTTMGTRKRIFAGQHLRRLREQLGLRQAEFALKLQISSSYLSQLEHDDRPLTPRLIELIASLYPLDWHDFEGDETDQLALMLREALADPVLDASLPFETIGRLTEQHPAFARAFVDLYGDYRRASQRLEMIDETLALDLRDDSRLPWEEVRDWFHLSNNYVDLIDRAAEQLAESLAGSDGSADSDALRQHLWENHRISVTISHGGALRRYDGATRVLFVSAGQSPASIRFQIAYQIAVTTLSSAIRETAENAQLRSDAARELLTVGLTNYAAGALLMPYSRFRHMARAFRHDVDRLSQFFQTSFEQTCHRLSTLQREGERGLPIFFCRVDLAGNITKRHSATRFQFARFGGACPLWIVHEAAAIPDRILIQLAETPDGVRYISIAKGVVKPSGSFDLNPRRFALALGCEVEHASEFVYADSVDPSSKRAATPIGTTCRICPRDNCDQRAYPPSDRAIHVDLFSRGAVPYQMRGLYD